MNEDLAVVKKYIDYVTDNDLVYKFERCFSCVDSELCLQPWSDGEEVGLFCLMPGCDYKTILGLTTIARMREDLKSWKVSL